MTYVHLTKYLCIFHLLWQCHTTLFHGNFAENKKMASSNVKHTKYRYTTYVVHYMWMSIFNQIDPQSILLQNSSIQTDTTAGASVAQIFLSRAMGGFQAENHDHCLHSGICTVWKFKNFSTTTQKLLFSHFLGLEFRFL